MHVCVPYLREDGGDMKQRINSIWKWLSDLWRSFRKWVTPALYVGAITVISSVILITFHNGILQAAGMAMLAAVFDNHDPAHPHIDIGGEFKKWGKIPLKQGIFPF